MKYDKQQYVGAYNAQIILDTISNINRAIIDDPDALVVLDALSPRTPEANYLKLVDDLLRLERNSK